jgi:uncharacterized protein (TIGR02145 family)
MKNTISLLAVLLLLAACEKELLPEFDTFTDPRDGYTYQIVQIGTQVWLAENLRYLPAVYDANDYRSQTEPYYYVYFYWGDNIEEAKSTPEFRLHGVLYNFPAASISCPDGWHLPDEIDFDRLTRFVGRNNGKAIRSKSGWSSGMLGDNSSGFNLLPSGYMEYGGFTAMNEEVNIWSSVPTELAGRVWGWGFPWSSKRFEKADLEIESGSPVRCIKD